MIGRQLRAFVADPRARTRWLAGYFRGAYTFRAARHRRLVNVQGRIIVDARGGIVVGDRVMFLAGIVPSCVVCLPHAELVIGAGTGFNYGVDIECTRSIRIGERCMIASMVSIHDRVGGRCAPIVIEDEAWIAHGAAIGPGVTVGARSVVSAGSVVTEDVPSNSLAIGNPARFVSLELMRARSAE